MNTTNTSSREYTVQFTKSEQSSISYFLDNMTSNKAYRPENPGSPEALKELEDMRARYVDYRGGWRSIPEEAIARKLHETFVQVMKRPPQSLDIETASLCDLACPHCFRQYIATPDKIISQDLFRRVIDQAAELGVPSVKFNWRGEPLMCPQLPEFVAYAKQKGIMETAINTNAVTLDAAKSRALIEAGLDMMIYSFDGGTAETYNKMRVGRFKENKFEDVYNNIIQFHKIREEMGSPFPRTRIQMVLTPGAKGEVEAFRRLFDPIVDDVLIKAYEERGLDLELYSEDQQNDFKTRLSARTGNEVTDLSNAMIWQKPDGDVLVAAGRLPCQQLYQRLMVAYDGSVYMCCNDWGTEHPIGYVDEAALQIGLKDHQSVYDRVQNGSKGFNLLANIEMPDRYNKPEPKVSTLSQIWDSPELNQVRRMHIEGQVNKVSACRKCTFIDTYKWDKL